MLRPTLREYHRSKEGTGMNRRPAHRKIRETLARVKRFFKREPESPGDPYAYVGAPRKPRLPQRSAAAQEPLD